MNLSWKVFGNWRSVLKSTWIRLFLIDIQIVHCKNLRVLKKISKQRCEYLDEKSIWGHLSGDSSCLYIVGTLFFFIIIFVGYNFEFLCLYICRWQRMLCPDMTVYCKQRIHMVTSIQSVSISSYLEHYLILDIPGKCFIALARL